MFIWVILESTVSGHSLEGGGGVDERSKFLNRISYSQLKYIGRCSEQYELWTNIIKNSLWSLPETIQMQKKWKEEGGGGE